MVMAYKKAVGTEYIPENYTAVERKEKKKVKTSRKYSWVVKVSPAMATIALIFIIGMALVAQHVWINFLGYQISELKQDITNLQITNEKLKLKIANKSSLAFVENIAKNQLGMTNPADKSVYYIFSPQGQEDIDPSQKYREMLVPTGEKQVSVNREIADKAWLGTVEDFFYHKLFAK